MNCLSLLIFLVPTIFKVSDLSFLIGVLCQVQMTFQCYQKECGKEKYEHRFLTDALREAGPESL